LPRTPREFSTIFALISTSSEPTSAMLAAPRTIAGQRFAEARQRR
jgi:hypothetical protein